MKDGEALPCRSIRVYAPEGTLFVNITEDSHGKPVHVEMIIGKAGSLLNAWVNACARMITVMLRHHNLSVIIEELSLITSDKMRTTPKGITCHSGPEAVVLALLIYQCEKFKEHYNEIPLAGKARFNG